ncbi:MAG: hypothetical protein KC503_06095 [Myxococcales bacterium]|nr:hypothetical protein [Myxococcales bacterium]
MSELLVKHGVAASQAEPCKDIWLGNHVSMLAPTKNFVKGPTALVVRAMPAATAKDKGTTACWISTEMVNNKVRWLVRPGAAPLADATTYRFKQLGNCWLVRFEAKSKVIEGAGPFHKHEWYTYMAASKDGVDVFEVTTYRARGTVPKTEQEERGTVRWLRVGKRHFLVHVLTKTTDDDDAKPSKETNVYALGADCMLVQLNKAEATKIRAQPGGKALPLPT